MQLIAEAYSVLKHIGGFNNDELATIFDTWNNGELESFLIEITTQIFKEIDPKTGKHLVDVITDTTAQKGTGKWTAEEALTTGTDASLLASAVFARFMSTKKMHVYMRASILNFDAPRVTIEDKDAFIESVRQALYASKIIAYAQGFDLLKNASVEYNWDLDFGAIARTFREGCIIRAAFLNRISDAYITDANLANLMIDASFKENLMDYQQSLRDVIAAAIQQGISMPAFTSAISYFDAYRTGRGNANLIQAQRDLFGAHTFERLDEPGHFHHEWNQKNA
ncbi:hypothetical protein MGH68_08220 [Erysipelothrix sp. D19-032]